MDMTDNFQYQKQFLDTENITRWDQRKKYRYEANKL